MSSSRSTVVSAPGKVLMAGGYLVLEKKYAGLVVATSSRFYSCISDIKSTGSSSALITVRAGQFPQESSTWQYTISLSGESLELTQINSTNRNKFIEISLSRTLAFSWKTLSTKFGDVKAGGEELLRRIRANGDGINIVVLADNDFYSQKEQLARANLPPRISSLHQIQPFHSLPRPIHETNKTGLGSSAALVTSLVASILSHLEIVSLESSLDTIHSIAQLAHCLAQGKVGSGFDVSSAVYGSHVYHRFSPEIIAPLMDAPITPITPSDLLSQLDPARWDQSVTPFRLPKGFRLLLADVDAGTDTPSFVGRVLKWRKNDPKESEEIWSRLDNANAMLRECIEGITRMEDEPGYQETLQRVSQYSFKEVSTSLNPLSQLDRSTDLGKNLGQLANIMSVIRGYLRVLSAACDVPVEPYEQTRLLDACYECPGVVGGGVPGAGGYDAIFLLVIDQPHVITAVEDLWESWTEMSVCPLSSKQSNDGLRLEQMSEVLMERLNAIDA